MTPLQPTDKAILTFFALVLLMSGGNWVYHLIRSLRAHKRAREMRQIDRAVRRDINTGSWT